MTRGPLISFLYIFHTREERNAHRAERIVQSVLSAEFRGLSAEWGREKDSGQLAEWRFHSGIGN